MDLSLLETNEFRLSGVADFSHELYSMANNHQLPSATTVLKWLREGGGDTICGPPKYYDDIDSLSSISLTRRLYDSCAEQLSLFCRGVPALQDCSRKARKAAADVDTKFRLLGRCFEHGKLEACLDDEELLQCVLKYLVRIGTLLLSGIAPFCSSRTDLRPSKMAVDMLINFRPHVTTLKNPLLVV